MSPYEYAHRLRNTARSSFPFRNEWAKDLGQFKSLGFVYDRSDKGSSFTVHNLLITNDKTGTLYLIVFEAPAAEWAAAWKTGEPMLKYLLIDDEI